MEEVNYIYVIEKWDDKAREWAPMHTGTNDLEEMGDLLNVMEAALPHRELRLAQYTVTEYQEIHEYS